jgi:hypothetical protein
VSGIRRRSADGLHGRIGYDDQKIGRLGARHLLGAASMSTTQTVRADTLNGITLLLDCSLDVHVSTPPQASWWCGSSSYPASRGGGESISAGPAHDWPASAALRKVRHQPSWRLSQHALGPGRSRPARRHRRAGGTSAIRYVWKRGLPHTCGWLRARFSSGMLPPWTCPTTCLSPSNAS